MEEFFRYYGKFIITCVCITIIIIIVTTVMIVTKNNQEKPGIDLETAPASQASPTFTSSEKTDYTKTYQSRVLTSESKIESINGIECHIATIMGLTDSDFLSKINSEIKSEVTKLVNLINQETSGMSNISKTVTAIMRYSASNILSIEISGAYFPVNNSSDYTNYEFGLNYNLVTKETIEFKDLFSDYDSMMNASQKLINESIIKKYAYNTTYNGKSKIESPDYSNVLEDRIKAIREPNYSFIVSANTITFILNPLDKENKASVKSPYKEEYNINIFSKYLNQGNPYVSGKNSVIVPGIKVSVVDNIKFEYNTNNFVWDLTITDTTSNLSGITIANLAATEFKTLQENKFSNKDLISQAEIIAYDTSIEKLKMVNASSKTFIFNRDTLKTNWYNNYLKNQREYQTYITEYGIYKGLDSIQRENVSETYYFYNNTLATSLDQIFNYSYKYDIYNKVNSAIYSGSLTSKELQEKYESDWIISISKEGIIINSKSGAFSNLAMSYDSFNLNRLK